MKTIIAILVTLSTHNVYADQKELSLTVSSASTMIELSGRAAQQVYRSLKIRENTDGSDEDGAPDTAKIGESISCFRSGADYSCVMYLDVNSGKITGG